MTHKGIHWLLLLPFSTLPWGAHPQYSGAPIGDEQHLPQGSSTAFNCSQTGAPPEDTWLNVTWILPNITLIQRGQNHVMEDETTFNLSENGAVLSLTNIQPKWYGDYYCIVLYREQNLYVTRFSLNTSYHYAAELYRQYRTTVMILILASGTVIAVITLVFSVIVWCRRSKLDRKSEKNIKTSLDAKCSTTNSAA